MKPNYLLTLLLVLPVFLLVSCQKETVNETEKTPYAGNEEVIVSHSDCKVFPAGVEKISPGNDQSCIEYDYNAQTGLLKLKHVNSGFNCCPELLYVLVYISNDTLLVEESEQSQDCLCSCLYDIEVSIPGISNGHYFLKLVEPYCGTQEKLEFEMDLSVSVQDMYCVPRTEYPWAVND